MIIYFTVNNHSPNKILYLEAKQKKSNKSIVAISTTNYGRRHLDRQNKPTQIQRLSLLRIGV